MCKSEGKSEVKSEMKSEVACSPGRAAPPACAARLEATLGSPTSSAEVWRGMERVSRGYGDPPERPGEEPEGWADMVGRPGKAKSFH